MIEAEPPARRESLLAGLRQRLYPPEFRIAPPDPAARIRARHEITALRDRVLALEARPEQRQLAAPPAGPGPDVDSDDGALVDTAMGLWRLRQRLAKLDDDQTTRGLRRSLVKAWDGLEKLGVTVQDHDRQPFDSGMRVEVLDFQPEPGLHSETIIETVQPTIYRFERSIQQGQVVVGQPEGETH